MDTLITCDYCKKKFSSKSNLNNHIKTAKYCINIRNSAIIQCPEIDDSKCNFCSKKFSTKYLLNSHLLKCQEKLKQDEKNLISEIDFLRENNILYKSKIEEKDKLITLKDQEIAFLKQQVERQTVEIENFKQQVATIALEGVKKHSVSNTSNHIMNILSPLDFNDEKINSIVEDTLDETYFLDSQKGIAKFCYDNLIQTPDGKRRLVCSDPVRERYKYIDGKGNLLEDIQARKFIEKVAKPIIDVSKKVHRDLKNKYNRIKEDIKRGFEKEMSDYLVEIKEKYAEQCLTDIKDIPYETRNKKFRKELAIRSRPQKTEDSDEKM